MTFATCPTCWQPNTLLSTCPDCSRGICSCCAFDSDAACVDCYRARNRREVCGQPRVLATMEGR